MVKSWWLAIDTFFRRTPFAVGSMPDMQVITGQAKSRSRLSLSDKGGGKILVCTEVPRMGRQSLPAHKGGDEADPTIAVAIGIHPNFARAARLVGISFLAPP